jgi:hypothetical protein
MSLELGVQRHHVIRGTHEVVIGGTHGYNRLLCHVALMLKTVLLYWSGRTGTSSLIMDVPNRLNLSDGRGPLEEV